jgi:molybdenum cofactor cytidylyltransferase
MMMPGGALVVAAGFSRRFGTDKRLHRVADDQPMLIATLRTYCAVFPNVAVVVRSDDSAIAQLVMASFYRNPPLLVTTDHAAAGMGASLSDGVRRLLAWDYLFIGLGDMPFVRVTTLRTLHQAMLDARHDALPRIVVPLHNGLPGHPVGFSCEFFGDLMELHGDRGARSIIGAHGSHVRQVQLDDDGIVRDIDRIEPER